MKKVIFIYALLIFSVNISKSQTGWFIQPAFTPKSFYCLEPTAIHNLYCGSDSGIVFKSADNGLNWTLFTQDTSVKRLPIRALYGGNNDDFGAVGDSTAYISKVNNQVTSMRIVTAANQTKPNLRAYTYIQGCCQYFAEIAAGDSGLVYIKDTNPWKRDSAAILLSAGTRINAASSIILVGNNGLIIKADSIGVIRPDGSRIKWRIVPSGTSQNLYGVRVVSSGICIAVGAGGIILKSTNFGDTWSSVTSPVQSDLYSINLTYASLICGANGVILKCTVSTLDNWFRQTTPTTQDLHSILGLTYTDYISMGNNGIILRTTDGGGPPAGLSAISGDVPDSYVLKQNYPNPFNPSTEINFSIPHSGVTKIIIYDLNGQEIAYLLHENLNSGTYKVSFSSEGIPSGVYFYKLSSGEFSESKKMIVIK